MAFLNAAVVVEGGEAGERGDPAFGEGNQLRAEREACGGREDTNALDLLEAFGFETQRLLRLQGGGEGGFQLVDLRLDEFDPGLGEFSGQGERVACELMEKRGTLHQRLLPSYDELVERALILAEEWISQPPPLDRRCGPACDGLHAEFDFWIQAAGAGSARPR